MFHRLRLFFWILSSKLRWLRFPPFWTSEKNTHAANPWPLSQRVMSRMDKENHHLEARHFFFARSKTISQRIVHIFFYIHLVHTSIYSMYCIIHICTLYVSNFSIDVFNKKGFESSFPATGWSFQVAVFVDRRVRVADGRFYQVDAESVIPSKWLPLRLQDVGLPRVEYSTGRW